MRFGPASSGKIKHVVPRSEAMRGSKGIASSAAAVGCTYLANMLSCLTRKQSKESN